jgi:hypothetical protein
VGVYDDLVMRTCDFAKFVGYVSFVLILAMLRFYAHEREILLKNASF